MVLVLEAEVLLHAVFLVNFAHASRLLLLVVSLVVVLEVSWVVVSSAKLALCSLWRLLWESASSAPPLHVE